MSQQLHSESGTMQSPNQQQTCPCQQLGRANQQLRCPNQQPKTTPSRALELVSLAPLVGILLQDGLQAFSALVFSSFGGFRVFGS